jgi:hypothetical protein
VRPAWQFVCVFVGVEDGGGGCGAGLVEELLTARAAGDPAHPHFATRGIDPASIKDTLRDLGT